VSWLDPAAQADLELVTPPASQLVTLDELKAQVSVELDDDSEDAEITAYGLAAVGHLDGYAGILGRALAQQSWKLYLDAFPPWTLRLPLPPLISVDAITYLDANGATQTLASTEYLAQAGERATVTPAFGKVWPVARCQARAVTVAFTAGWPAPAAGQPWPAKLQPVIAAIKLMVGDLYANRETAVTDGRTAEIPMSTTVERLLRPLRIPRF
jgi:uncharacterized phiE125 gp8 family phage protein